jgi:hypothetical protein
MRNAIYSFISEPTNVRLISQPAEVTLVLSSTFGTRQLRSTGGFTWRMSKRTSLGLTQVCRDIRAEVLPLHRDAYKINTQLRYLNSVGELDTATLQSHGEIKRSVTHVVSSWPISLDLLALVRQTQKVSITCSRRREIKECASQCVDDILKGFKTTGGAYFVKTKVQNMLFTMQRYRPRLAIVVQPEGREHWMPYDGSNMAQWVKYEAEREWLERIGLGKTGFEPRNVDIA